MTIDPETKKYIDEQMSTVTLKVSAFFSALCQSLEQKNVLQPGEFNQILMKAHHAASFAAALGHGKVESFNKIFADAIKDLEKQAQKRNWSDLK